ncbi:MAG: hypothetical protein Q7R86_03080, partial [bacterium]|nr:hypothetical protein [bacterium]
MKKLILATLTMILTLSGTIISCHPAPEPTPIPNPLSTSTLAPTPSLTLDPTPTLAIKPTPSPTPIPTPTPTPSIPIQDNEIRAQKALDYILAQQGLSGLFRSYEDQTIAHTFDQALSLRALSIKMEELGKKNSNYERYYQSARKLVERIIQLQHSDGSWWNAYNYTTAAGDTPDQGRGVMAWVTYALSDYTRITGEQDAYNSARRSGEWLEKRMENGAIFTTFGKNKIWITEDNLDSWFAFESLTLTAQSIKDTERANHYQGIANQIKDHLLNRALNSYSWSGTGKSGKIISGSYFAAGIRVDTERVDNSEPFLDNQTWGAYFLRYIGKDNEANKLLGFAYNNFYLEENKLFGLDSRVHKDTLKPIAINWEFTLHYIAAGGKNSQILLNMVNSQQREGGYPHDSLDVSGEYWHKDERGVNATTWAYAVNSNTSLLRLTRPTPAPTLTPKPTPAEEVKIEVRSDGFYRDGKRIFIGAGVNWRGVNYDNNFDGYNRVTNFFIQVKPELAAIRAISQKG